MFYKNSKNLGNKTHKTPFVCIWMLVLFTLTKLHNESYINIVLNERLFGASPGLFHFFSGRESLIPSRTFSDCIQESRTYLMEFFQYNSKFSGLFRVAHVTTQSWSESVDSNIKMTYSSGTSRHFKQIFTGWKTLQCLSKHQLTIVSHADKHSNWSYCCGYLKAVLIADHYNRQNVSIISFNLDRVSILRSYDSNLYK